MCLNIISEVGPHEGTSGWFVPLTQKLFAPLTCDALLQIRVLSLSVTLCNRRLVLPSGQTNEPMQLSFEAGKMLMT